MAIVMVGDFHQWFVGLTLEHAKISWEWKIVTIGITIEWEIDWDMITIWIILVQDQILPHRNDDE